MLLHGDGTPDRVWACNGLLVVPSQDGCRVRHVGGLRTAGTVTMAFSVNAPLEAGTPYDIYRYRPDGTPDPVFGIPGRGSPCPGGQVGLMPPSRPSPRTRAVAPSSKNARSSRPRRQRPFPPGSFAFCPAVPSTSIWDLRFQRISGPRRGVLAWFKVADRDGSTYLAGRSARAGQQPGAPRYGRSRADGRMDPTSAQADWRASSPPAPPTSPDSPSPCSHPGGSRPRRSAPTPLQRTRHQLGDVVVFAPTGLLKRPSATQARSPSTTAPLGRVGAGTDGRILLITEPSGTSGSGDIVRAYTTDLPIPSPPPSPQ